MKKLLMVVLGGLIVLNFVAQFCWAEGAEIPLLDGSVAFKQGVIMSWDDHQVDNLSTTVLARTMPFNGWGNWNTLWDGWSVDGGVAYDATAIDTGALLIGRELGTLGKYFPIDFPLKDKINITIYPLGLIVNDIFSKPEIDGCSGLAYVKGSLKF